MAVLLVAASAWACLSSPTPGAVEEQAPDPTDTPPDPGATVVSCPAPDPAPTSPPAPGALPAVALSMNAVSVLYPVALGDASGLLSLSEAGRGGPLLPVEHFDAVPVFADNPLPGRAYELWRIVAARIDPCFPSLSLRETAPHACRPQLRLVAQPQPERFFDFIDDNTLHLHYDLSAAEFEDLARRWVAPLENQPGARAEPLDVSPTLQAQGLSGAYASVLKALIKQFAGPETLTRVTFMEGAGVAWTFGGFDLERGVRKSMTIPAVEPRTTRQMTHASSNQSPFHLMPASPFSRTLEALSGELVSNDQDPGGQLVLQSSCDERRAALQLTYDIDNPKTGHHAEATDCASCHFANRARDRAVRIQTASTNGLARYQHPTRPVEPSRTFDVRVQRAFGYSNGRPIVSPRVIHESAEVADAIEALVSAQ